ncbi:hypothetical protein BG011_006827 [Mortierella polycephala]|uniref:Uncharacterized protein n=1 Tax=Mortierella polycephala TaxID=41804 RepID=A0A9P6PV78_9FUNG|nr:hypothetical protein BG011_006827 [Mortierella polycephala]
MTHLSDYSFIQRTVSSSWFYIWFLVYVFRYDRFAALSYRRIMRFELRSIVTFLLLIGMPLSMSYNIGIAAIKYEEGFWVNEKTGAIMAKPSFLWSQENQDRATILEYVLACGMAVMASLFFLLQSFYHYISKSVTKSSFMSSFEFRLNIVCSFAVLVVFPLVQFIFRNSHEAREAGPQMAFSAVLLIITFLGVRTHYRFKSLLKVAMLTISESTHGVVEKLEYFKDMNLVLTGAMFGTGMPLTIASADGLTSHPVIASNKFASDFLVCSLNFFEFLIWVTLVLIFYPRRSAVGAVFGSSNGGSLSRTAPTSTRLHTVKTVHDQQTYNNGSNTTRSHQNNNNDNTSKDRPLSVVIPYKPPGSSDHPKVEYNDHLNNPSSGHNSHNMPYHDTFPLTQAVGQQDATDYVQMNAFKALYDPLQDDNPVTPISPRRQDKLIRSTQSPPQSPVSPSYQRAISPLSFNTQRHSGSISSPTPTYGSPAAMARVGQQTFVLEDPPGVAHQRAKLAMQQQQQAFSMNDYDQSGSITPARPKKEPRSAPTY